MEEKASYALQSVVCDHIRSDIIIIDDLTKKPLGRIWITFIYDEFSNLILGLHMGFNPPSYNSIILALKNAVLPKDYIKEVYPSVKNEWKAFGIPNKLCIDNGKEMHSKQLQEICHLLGIELLYKPAGKPEIKIKIERFFSTLNEKLINGLPGVSFSPIKKQGINEKNISVLSLNDFSEIFHQWLLDIYSTSYHRSLKGIPNVLWEESIKNFPPMLTVGDGCLDLLFGLRTLRRIRKDGIQLNYLLYNSSKLQLFRQESIRLKKDIIAEVVQNPDDFSKIYVFNQIEKSYIEVPCLNGEYTKNLNLSFHSFVIREIPKQEKMVDRDALNNAKLRMQKMINQCVQGKKVNGGMNKDE